VCGPSAWKASAVTVARPGGYLLAVGMRLMMVGTMADGGSRHGLPLLGSTSGYRHRNAEDRREGLGRVGGPRRPRVVDLSGLDLASATPTVRGIRETSGGVRS
jgi:hypothetical protein